VATMPIDLKSIEERLAKAKEEAAYWEKAQAVFNDPRWKDLSVPESQPVNGVLAKSVAPPVPGAYGSLRAMVHGALPNGDAAAAERKTSKDVVSQLQSGGYEFNAKDPIVAVNSALIALEEKGLAESLGKRGLAKLWRKKKQKSQEAPEGAS
jgi:hypothetical protein